MNVLDIYVSESRDWSTQLSQHFSVKLLDPAASYGLTFTKESEVNRYLASCDMRYYTNQVNFAVNCATALCGLPDMTSVTQPLIKAVYQFHFYYQVRKILKTLQCPLPTDDTFNASKNNINLTQFIKLCNEFRVPTTTDFRTKKGDNNGLGTAYFMGYAIHGNGYIEHRSNYALPDKHYTFAESQHIAKIQRIQQGNDGWKYFITPKDALTNPGIVRLNDSIRTYLYCVLGAQAETRSAIVGQFGTELDAQKQFVKLLEDSINQHADIPTSIARYQKALTDTHTRLDYVIAPGLYIIGSDMVLKMGMIENYNNNILIASPSMKVGKNEINSLKNKAPALMKGSPVIKSVLKTNTPKHLTAPPDATQSHATTTQHAQAQEVTTQTDQQKRQQSEHETTKFLLYALLGGAVSVAIYYAK